MQRTALMLTRVMGARRRASHTSSRAAQGASKLAELKKRLREDEAERAFMEKIQEDRRRREKVIANALRRALAKRAKEESRFLRQYEANKLKAAEELRKMKKMEAPLAVAAPQPPVRLHPPRVKKAVAPLVKEERRIEEEREAERNFFELIEKLRRKRESEMLAEKEFNESLAAHAPSLKEGAHEVGGGEVAGAPRASEEPADSLTAQHRLGADELAAAVAEVVEEPKEVTVEETREQPRLEMSLEESSFVGSDEAAQEVQGGSVAKARSRRLQPRQEAIKPREKRIKKTPVMERVPAAQQMVDHEPVTQQMAADNFTDYFPSTFDHVQPPVFPRPLHAVSLTGFNEPPLISSVRNTLDVGQRRVQPMPSLEAPVIPLRPRTYDAFPPVARMAQVMPVSFPHNIPTVRPTRERPPTGAGLHRL
ncbi:uncharacterized protein Tco025E_06356 [Trypanosoma conorhini]|uniref:Uncharacterized protein n=1 Tax=Trypanosoma conorhini TaxID=83891 RepID=A0A422P5U5_9TRYP|nr:uncharacterized protein Tco025E_06356 [Trypanosoma conorhini]RNF13093.1 hypothetical protein Tco025E_06356 [Trypanosoma conorhini]